MRTQTGLGRQRRAGESTSVAASLLRILTLVLGTEPQLRLRAWDGSTAGDENFPLLEVESPDAVRRLAHR